MATSIIIVYAHLDPEQMIQKGLEAGLSEEAADYFRYFNEVKLELTVNNLSGDVLNCKYLPIGNPRR